MLVIGGPASNGREDSIGKSLHARSVKAVSKLFPDGESYVKMPEGIEGEDVVLVQSTYSPQDKHIMELLLMADTARELGAKSITAVVPYMAYLRQDRRFLDGEAISSQAVLRLINSVGVSSLAVVQPHKSTPFDAFNGRVCIVDPVPVQAKAISKILNDPIVLAPDKGGVARAKELAEILGCKYSHIDKVRDSITWEVKIEAPLVGSFKGKDVVIIDDIISTGGTIAQASREVLSKGAEKVVAVATHLVMASGAKDRMKGAGVSEIFGTNTVPYDGAKILDIGGQIATSLKA